MEASLKNGMDLLNRVADALGVSKAQLAGMLMVTERSLYDWAVRPADELPPKGRRLVRLVEVVDELVVLMQKHDIPLDKMRSVLNDGAVPINYGDADDPPMSLISYVTAFPEEHGWKANVTAAVLDYKEYMKAQKEFRDAQAERRQRA